MCGIAGSTRADPGILAALLGGIHHRGPDGTGTWRDPTSTTGLVHARLAIIDLSPGGAQPRLSDDGRYAITYNGEIFNYRTLRAELEAAGERFASASDTEILLRLLMREGVAGLERVVGMYAFALWDREARELLLGRDRFGIKPLVYAELADGNLAFASEIAALRRHPGVALELDRQALSEYLACLYVPAPRTLYRGISKLPPGHVLRWRDGRIVERRAYWQPRVTGGRRPTLDQAVEELLPLLRRAIADHMVADVPIGCFLSGGIDSSIIAALMSEELRRQGGPALRSYTMTFAERAYDESEAARQVATAVGSTHVELAASPHLAAASGEMVDRFGEPFGNPTALLIHDLSRQARQHVTVALVGDGGDEVFAGYPRYRGGLLAQRYRRLPSALRRAAAPLAELIRESSSGRHGLRRAREFLTGAAQPEAEMYAGWVEYFSPAERRDLLGLADFPERPIAALYRAASSSDPLDAMQETDLASFLPGNLLAYGDAMSMAHALELRLPLLDHRVVEAVGRIDPALRFARGQKTLLKAVAARLLPRNIVERPKRGFNPPMGVWLKGELAPLVAERLRPERLATLGLDWAPVQRLLDEQRRGVRDHALKLWSLLVLDLWRERQGGETRDAAA
jgi:asparagine synthase (glutamine-hydrolysing)